MRIACFKHVSFEGPASIAGWASSRGHSLEEIDIFDGTELPKPDQFDMLLVMGGPMNIYQETEFPWLAGEKQAISDAVAEGKYIVGICLGAQLVADVLGGPVRRGNDVEIGWLPIRRSDFCPEQLPMPEEIRVYHWHGDTFTLPPESALIASSVGCANQIFLQKEQILGLQCHLETTPESVKALIGACSNEIVDGKYIQSAEEMLNEPNATFEQMHDALFAMLDHLTSDA